VLAAIKTFFTVRAREILTLGITNNQNEFRRVRGLKVQNWAA
jgi:hypothetical protein